MLVSFGLFAGAHAAYGQCQYEISAVIQAPPCPFTGPPVTVGHAMNEQGHVVGRFADCATSFDHAFVWTPKGGFEQLPQPADVIDMVANDINDNQTIVGTWTREDVGTRGFVFDPKTEEYTELPPVLPDGPWSLADTISNEGVVAGERNIGEAVNVFTAFTWTFEDGFTDLGLIDGESSFASDISESGLIGSVGTQFGGGIAFHWSEKEFTFLPKTKNVSDCGANAINGNGVIAGGAEVLLRDGRTQVVRPVLWPDGKDGETVLLSAVDGYTNATALAINDLQVLVGQASNSTNDMHAFVNVNGETHDLNNLLQSTMNAELERAFAVNNAGVILVKGKVDNDVVAILVEPIDPSPADLNGDCVVAEEDLIILLEAWAQSDINQADLNGDQNIGVTDLLILLTNWG